MTAGSYEAVLAEVREIVARQFGVNVEELTEATMREDVDGWDSVSFPGLLLGIEDECRVSLPPEEAVAIETIGDLARLVHAVKNPS